MKRTIRVFSLLLAAVMLLSAQALATEPAQAVTDVEHSGQYLCGLPRVEPARSRLSGVKDSMTTDPE